MKAHEACERVAHLVHVERETTHGEKRPNFSRIATLWNAYLEVRRDPAARLGAEDVGHMMVLLKIARAHLGAFNPDDYIDAIGYAACVAEIAMADNAAPSANTAYRSASPEEDGESGREDFGA